MADPISPVPNEDKKPPVQQKPQPQADPPMAEDNQEASAADLLSLWGSKTVAPVTPKPVAPVIPKSLPAVAPTAPKPVASVRPVPPKQSPAVTSLPKTEVKANPPAPAPLFTAMPKPTPAPVAALPPIPPPKPYTPPAVTQPPIKPIQTPKPKEQKPTSQVSWGDIVSPKPQPQPPPPKDSKPEVIEGELVGEVKSKPEKQVEDSPSTLQRVQGRREQSRTATNSGQEGAGVEFFDEEGSFAAKLEEFLHEFNLKPAHIFYAIGGLVAVIILIFGGIWGFKYFTNGSVKIAVPERPATVILRDETGVPSTADVGETIAFTAGMIGSSGIFSTIPMGTEAESRSALVSYLVLFRRVQNAYTTNIDELLNKTTNRRARLAGHLSLLRSLYTESEKAIENIKKETAIIQTQYSPYKIRQEEVDKNFFEQLDEFNGQTTEDLLYDFINVSKVMISLQSRFKALNKIQSFFEIALPKIERRIHDIKLNEDALVSGIKVYDVQGSDLQLILPVEGETKAEDKLSYPSVPFLSPFQLTGGKDFISQPGGGFAN